MLQINNILKEVKMKRQQVSTVLLLSAFLAFLCSIALFSLPEEGTGDIMCQWIDGCSGSESQWCDDTDRWEVNEECVLKCYTGTQVKIVWCTKEI
jgi:hypothetical protein